MALRTSDLHVHLEQSTLDRLFHFLIWQICIHQPQTQGLESNKSINESIS